MAFIASAWWDLGAECEAGFSARLLTLDGKRVAATNDFDSNGGLKEKNAAAILLLDEGGAKELVQSLQGKNLVVKSTEESPRTERPKAPFTTSTMQQDAGSRLGWGAQLTMRVAQRLYENGFITYMRTDSVRIAPEAIEDVRKFIKGRYGQNYLTEEQADTLLNQLHHEIEVNETSGIGVLNTDTEQPNDTPDCAA